MGKLDDHIDALVDDTVAPYAAYLSPASMEQLRALLSDALATHPVLSDLVGELMPRHVEESGEVPVDGAEPKSDSNGGQQRG